MQALCKDWTEGSPPVFAVVDGLGAWNGDNELCVTQQGQTPMIAAWTTTSQWTQLGSPYLWWTGPDDAAVLAAAGPVGARRQAARRHGQGGRRRRRTRRATRTPSTTDLLPDLKKIGVTPTRRDRRRRQRLDRHHELGCPARRGAVQGGGRDVGHPARPGATRSSPTSGPRRRSSTSRRLLLSDYEQSIGLGLGLIPVPYEKALDGQEGVTTETLGGFDDTRPESQGGYDPGVRACYQSWHAAYPKPPKGSRELLHRGAGTRSRRGAAPSGSSRRRPPTPGQSLNRTHVRDRDVQDHQLPRQHSRRCGPSGPTKFYGPTQYQVVKLHNNVPPSSQCKLKTNHKPQGTCWVTVQPFKPLPPASG